MARIFGLDIPSGLIEQFYNALTLKPSGEAESLGKRRPTVSYATAETVGSRSLFRIFEPTWDTFLQDRRNRWASYWTSLPFGTHSGSGGWPGSGFSAFTYLNAPRWRAGLPLLLEPPFFHNLVSFRTSSPGLRQGYYDAGSFSNITTQFLSFSSEVNIAALDSQTFVTANKSGGRIQAWRFNGTWQPLGNSKLVTGNGSDTQIFAMSTNRVVIYLSSSHKIHTLDFDGSDWNEVGSGVDIGARGVACGCQFSPTRIALGGTIADTLQAYDWTGSTWVAVGSPLTINGQLSNFAVGLTSTLMITNSILNTGLQAFRFNGSTWTAVGTPTTSLYFGFISEQRLSHDTFAVFQSGGSNGVYVFNFDGENITLQAFTTLLGTQSTTAIVGLPD
jgi:hypothetical protein